MCQLRLSLRSQVSVFLRVCDRERESDEANIENEVDRVHFIGFT